MSQTGRGTLRSLVESGCQCNSLATTPYTADHHARSCTLPTTSPSSSLTSFRSSRMPSRRPGLPAARGLPSPRAPVTAPAVDLALVTREGRATRTNAQYDRYDKGCGGWVEWCEARDIDPDDVGRLTGEHIAQYLFWRTNELRCALSMGWQIRSALMARFERLGRGLGA